MAMHPVHSGAPQQWCEFEWPISRHSSEEVPRAGIWVLTDRLDVRQRFETGDTLPQYEERDVEWLWVSCNPSSFQQIFH
jgi:hypothetical protein